MDFTATYSKRLYPSDVFFFFSLQSNQNERTVVICFALYSQLPLSASPVAAEVAHPEQRPQQLLTSM
jgi:hypothetical protein